jgi:hypothetical protein
VRLFCLPRVSRKMKSNYPLVAGAVGTSPITVWASNATDVILDLSGYLVPPNPDGQAHGSALERDFQFNPSVVNTRHKLTIGTLLKMDQTVSLHRSQCSGEIRCCSS